MINMAAERGSIVMSACSEMWIRSRRDKHNRRKLKNPAGQVQGGIKSTVNSWYFSQNSQMRNQMVTPNGKAPFGAEGVRLPPPQSRINYIMAHHGAHCKTFLRSRAFGGAY